jgi:hypothetical protein
MSEEAKFVLAAISIVCLCAAILLTFITGVLWLSAPGTQKIAALHGIELTRWEAMWISRHDIPSIVKTINTNTENNK